MDGLALNALSQYNSQHADAAAGGDAHLLEGSREDGGGDGGGGGGGGPPDDGAGFITKTVSGARACTLSELI